MFKGKCHCESVEYVITTKPQDCCLCYCSVCRKLTGSGMGAYGASKLENFQWVRGEDCLSDYQQNQTTTRYFCQRCGSYLASKHSQSPKMIYLSLGCLDGSAKLELKYQQFVASRPSWATTMSDVPTHDEWPEWIAQHLE